MTGVALIEGWVSKPLEGVTGVEVVEKVWGLKVLVLSTDIRGELEEGEELVAAFRAAWNLAALRLSLACLSQRRWMLDRMQRFLES